MALQSYVNSFNTGTGAAASTIPITGVGFQPKAILFWWSGRSEAVDTIGRASHYRGFGVAVSPTDRRSIANASIDAQATTDTQHAQDAAACILSIDPATPSIDGQLDLQSMDADGFTLVVDDQMPRDMRVHYLALGGASLTNAVTGSIAEPAATGNQDTTSLAFQPDMVLFFGVHSGTAPPMASAGQQFLIGAATSATARGVLSTVSRSAQGTSDTSSYAISSECIAHMTTTGVVNARADFVSFLSNGFRINWTERTTTGRIVFFLALKGGNYRVDNLLTQTDTVTDITESGFGFAPSAAMFFSHGQVESTADTSQTQDRVSIGAFSSLTARGTQGTLDEDNSADSEVTTAVEFDEVYANISLTSTIDGLMDVKAIGSDGFTMIMDDADPAQEFVWYLAFGPAAGSGPTMTLVPSNMRGRFRNPAGGFTN